MSPIVRRLLWTLILASALLSFAVGRLIVRRSLILGSVEGNWVYRFIQPFRPSFLIVAAVAIAIALAVLAAESAIPRVWVRLAIWFVAGLAIQGLLRALTPYSFEEMFASPGANSFHDVATRHSAAAVLRNYASLRDSWPIHAQSNLPGKILMVHAFSIVTNHPGTMAWLVAIVSNLGAFLIYAFTRQAVGDRTAAVWAAALYLIVPAKLYFLPLMNTLTPVVALGCACLLQRWIRTARAVDAAAFGAALYLLVLWEPLPLVLGLLFAVLLFRALRHGVLTWRLMLTQSVVAVAAFAVVYVAMWQLFGFELLPSLLRISDHAAAFNRESNRPYGIWVRQNLFDFAFGIGICQAVLVLPALADGLFSGPRRMWTTPIAVLSVTLVVVLLVTDLLGINRGEVVRLWIFLACLFQIPAAYVCARLESRVAMGLVMTMALLQDAVGTAMMGFIIP